MSAISAGIAPSAIRYISRAMCITRFTRDATARSTEKRMKKTCCKSCCKCGAAIHDADTVGINRKLLGQRTRKFMCVPCLAEFFGTKESTLRAKIEELKDSGCPLFS